MVDAGRLPPSLPGMAAGPIRTPHHLPLVLGVAQRHTPPGQEVKLLDGVMLAARSNTLAEKGLRFNPLFDLHFYDLDFAGKPNFAS